MVASVSYPLASSRWQKRSYLFRNQIFLFYQLVFMIFHLHHKKHYFFISSKRIEKILLPLIQQNLQSVFIKTNYNSKYVSLKSLNNWTAWFFIRLSSAFSDLLCNLLNFFCALKISSINLSVSFCWGSSKILDVSDPSLY